MESALEAPQVLTQPGAWSLLAQGAANYVFEAGDHVGWVLRLPKARKAAPRTSREGVMDELIWAPFMDGKFLAWLDANFALRIIGDHIDRRYLPDQHKVSLSKNFSVTLARKCGLDDLISCNSGSLLRDARMVQRLAGTLCGMVSFEIKPKWGTSSLGTCPSVLPEHRLIKKSASRYQLHQILKAERRSIESISSYDPRDFFSGDPAQLLKSLISLADHPQNNWMVRVHGARTENLSSAAEVLGIPGGCLALLELLANILLQEDLLNQVLQLQQLCEMDITGVHNVYTRLQGRIKGQTGGDQSTISQSDLDLLRRYLLACTARDCGIIISLQRVSTTTVLGRATAFSTFCQEGDQPGWIPVPNEFKSVFMYRLTLVDLDRKPCWKIPAHLDLDQQIMRAVAARQ